MKQGEGGIDRAGIGELEAPVPPARGVRVRRGRQIAQPAEEAMDERALWTRELG